MQSLASIEPLLRCPRTGDAMRLEDGAFVSCGDPSLRLPIEEGIVRAFVPHEGLDADVTTEMRSFYEQNPFPDYDRMDDLGVLIERSRERGFPEMLNRSIPFHATVLEVGCGTGQLGNFLSIPGRRVLSCDMCLNSLRLGETFRSRHGLGVVFAQMNLFRLPLQPERFDVVLCTGVLHHTDDPRGGMQRLLEFLKPGGILIVGLYNRFGRVKTRLRRRLFSLLGERFVHLDPYVRGYGVEAEKRHAWFMDQYRNPHESLHTMTEVLRWFDEDGVEFLRGVPSCEFGDEFRPDYRRSLFEPASRGSAADRLLTQLQQMLQDDEGGLFVMIGRKSPAGRPSQAAAARAAIDAPAAP